MTIEHDQATSQTPAEAPPPPPAKAAPPPPPATSASRRGLTARHVVSVILALFPGLGHVYNGLYLRGIVLFLLAVTSIYLATEEGLMGMVVAFVWLFNIIDAYRQASLIEQGHGPDLGVQDAAKAPPAGQLALLGGAGLFLFGFLLLLDHTFGYDMDRVWEFWPVGLLAVGAWLMIGASMQWRRNRTSQSASDEFRP